MVVNVLAALTMGGLVYHLQGHVVSNVLDAFG